MKKNKFGDYRLNIQFEFLSGYVAHVIFSDDIVRSCTNRYGTCSARDTAEAFVRHSTFEGRTHMFFPMTATEEDIAHEAWHVIYHMFDWVGAKDFDNEITAYHLGHLVGKIHKFKREVEAHVSKKQIACGTPSGL